MADEHPPPEDVERAGELARERGWKDIGGQGVVSDPAKTLHVPSSIDTFNPAGEPTAYPATSPESPCSVCGTYGHFTHNHERETSSPAMRPSE